MKKEANAQPAYAESFGVASAHSSRRSEAKEERPMPNAEYRRAIMLVLVLMLMIMIMIGV
jgi:hypothetical protein